jgi:hypothetical protein
LCGILQIIRLTSAHFYKFLKSGRILVYKGRSVHANIKILDNQKGKVNVDEDSCNKEIFDRE